MNQQPSGQGNEQREDQSPAAQKQISLLSVVLSVIQASFGVQNARNRQRDFTHGKFGIFVAVAVVFTVLFVLTIVGIVSLVLPDAG